MVDWVNQFREVKSSDGRYHSFAERSLSVFQGRVCQLVCQRVDDRVRVLQWMETGEFPLKFLLTFPSVQRSFRLSKMADSEGFLNNLNILGSKIGKFHLNLHIIQVTSWFHSIKIGQAAHQFVALKTLCRTSFGTNTIWPGICPQIPLQKRRQEMALIN